jgi:hypothetical protein
MRNTRAFDVCGLNIRVHSEHKPTEYVALWTQLAETRQFVTHANTALMIGDVRYEDDSNPASRLYGYFYRFLDVDMDHPWFNIERHKKASEREVAGVSIPVELKPGLVEIPYMFDVVAHKLYFVAHETQADLSPRMVKKLLTALCSADDVVERFGTVDLTVVTDKGKVAELLKWPVIRTLTIELERPNPTDEEDEEYFYEKLAARRLASQTIIYKKAPEEITIVPDEEMKRLARVAANNGVVTVSGKNPQQESAKASSKEYPLALKGSYNPAQQSLMDALKSLVYSILPKKSQ